ncbi:MAG: U32 family peptidase [Candidatus Azobacteroides sp.]|nr:U32 family peptidase [Candidatus Azobacteroides sp.]
MDIRKNIELLSPARNLFCGMEAVNHGADAVYIGAPKFSARAAAGNSLSDIEQLIKYAHLYSVKTYIAFNTLLKQEELEEAEKLIRRLYEAGCDALIIQDMGILEMNLPPIPVHASTQTDNRTTEKIKFLEANGFSQVVLARELSLNEIKQIAAETSVRLEAFVHGALCVGYSGQCYLSEACCGRSANRGECAQYCRLPYTLKDRKGKVILKDKHFLSLKDLNLSENLEELLKAGVSSFKIEGRLKDLSYVKNITAYYRQKLDLVLSGLPAYTKSSVGTSTYYFVPAPEKTFNRGFTSYFLHGRQQDITSFETPKSLGEFIGKIKSMQNNKIKLFNKHDLQNGDGICVVTPSGAFFGSRVHKVEGEYIFSNLPLLPAGSKIYRNFDKNFEKKLSLKTAERKVNLTLFFNETPSGFSLSGETEDHLKLTLNFPWKKEPAKEPQYDNIKTQLSKFGNTIFNILLFEADCNQHYFIPSSILSSWRKKFIEHLYILKNINYRREYRRSQKNYISYPQSSLTYLGNVINSNSFKFYQQSGVNRIDMSTIEKKSTEQTLMFTKYCIRERLGWCQKNSIKEKSNFSVESLYLEYNHLILKIEFDCKVCEMKISRYSG